MTIPYTYIYIMRYLLNDKWLVEMTIPYTYIYIMWYLLNDKWLVEMTIPFLQSCARVRVHASEMWFESTYCEYVTLISPNPYPMSRHGGASKFHRFSMYKYDYLPSHWLCGLAIDNIMLWLSIQYKGVKQSTICSRFLQSKLYHTAE